MCMFCNTHSPDAANNPTRWTLSVWHVVEERTGSKDTIEIGLCSTGPHPLPEPLNFEDPIELVGKFAEGMQMFHNLTVIIDAHATTDAYIVGYIGQGESIEDFDRLGFFLVHGEDADPEQICGDVNAIGAMEAALHGTTE